MENNNVQITVLSAGYDSLNINHKLCKTYLESSNWWSWENAIKLYNKQQVCSTYNETEIGIKES